MTKEDFWADKSQYCEDFGDLMDSNDFFECMEKYSEQEAIAFAVWKDKNGYEIPNSNTPRTWYKRGDSWPAIVYTDAELYQLYKKVSNEQE
jgi:hypothetical protein